MLPRNVEHAVCISQAAQLGELIRARRKKFGYTQQFVADMMGCSPRLIGEIERGKQTVSIQTVINLAQGLGIDLFAVPRGE